MADDVNMVNFDLNTLEVGPVLLLERNRDIQSGIESRAALAVFVLPGVLSCDSCLDLSCPKGEWTPRCVCWFANPGMAETLDVSMAVSETNDASHDMILPCCDEGAKVYHEGWRSKLELEPNGVVELPVDTVPHDAQTVGGKGKMGSVSSLSELAQIEGTVVTIAN